jgi:hypothetical protein
MFKEAGVKMKYESWGFLPHLNNGEMFAITFLALAGLWLALGLIEKRDYNDHDFN